MREEPLRSTRERSMSLPAALRFNREIAQFAKQKQFDLAILCYKRMLASRIAPDVVTYNTMINVYVKMQRLEDAFALFEQMKSEGIDPTIVTYTSLVDGCGKSGNFAMAMALYGEVTASAVEPNMHFFNAVMNAGLINGSGVVIQEVLAEIGRRKMRPNTVTYNTLLSGYLRFDQLDSMKAVVEQMKNERVEFSSVTQATILQAVQLARSVGDIDKFMDLLAVARIVPSQVQGSQAVQDLIVAGRVVLAQELCVRLMGMGCVLTNEVLLNLVDLAGDCANFGVLKWAGELGMRIGADLFFAQLNGFARLNYVEKVKKMYRQAEASGCVIPLKVRVSVLKCLLEMNEGELAGRVAERVVAALRNEDHFDDLKNVFQVFYEHDMTDKILALYGATEAKAGKFDNMASEYIVAAVMRNQTRLREVSLEKLDLVFPSVLQLLTLSAEDLRAVKIVPALLRMTTVPSSLDFHKILMKVYGKLGFRDFWACFRHFAELGAEVFQQTIDMVDSWEDLNSYEDTSFIMALARDAGLEVPADLYSVALMAALNIGNFGDALALHDEMDSLKLKASAQAEQKYNELFGQANEMSQTLRNRKRMQQIRTRSRSQRGHIHTYFSDPSFTQSCSVLESSL